MVSRIYCLGCNNTVLLSIIKQKKKIRPTFTLCYIMNGSKIICDKCVEAGTQINHIINNALLTKRWLAIYMVLPHFSTEMWLKWSTKVKKAEVNIQPSLRNANIQWRLSYVKLLFIQNISPFLIG